MEKVRLVPRQVRGAVFFDVVIGALRTVGALHRDRHGRTVATALGGEVAMFRSDGEAVAWLGARIGRDVTLELEYFEVIYPDGERIPFESYEAAEKAAAGTADVIEKIWERIAGDEIQYVRAGRYHLCKEARAVKGQKKRAEAWRQRQDDDIERRRTPKRAATKTPA